MRYTGNPGTGKTTVARVFGKLLHASGARKSSIYLELKAQHILIYGEEAFAEFIHYVLHPSEGAAAMRSPAGLPPAQEKAVKLLKKALKGKDLLHTALPGGVLVVDDAHLLDPAKNSTGRAVHSFLLEAAEEQRDVLSIILVGGLKPMQQNLLAYDLTMKSLFSDVYFKDYDFSELRQIWQRLLAKYIDSSSNTSWLCDDEVTDIAVRRIARGIENPGFGNGREVRNAFERAASCAQTRTDFEPKQPRITVVDVIGPPPQPERIPGLQAALQDLHQLEGLEEVKSAVQHLIEMNQRNYFLEQRGEKVLDIRKNRIFWVSK